MELELGLKLARASDDFSSFFHVSKDRAGPVFKSSETEYTFILTAHLKGYERKNIRIDINEDGTVIVISGKRPVKEILTVGSKVYKKDSEVFKKVFKIPDGVILDKIKATYNEDGSILKVAMPKKVGGICGTIIEEVKEEHEKELVRAGSSNLQIGDENVNGQYAKTSNQEKEEKDKTSNQEKEEEKDTEAEKDAETSNQEKEEEKYTEPEKDVHENEGRLEEGNQGRFSDEHEKGQGQNEDDDKAKRCKMCVPIMAAGSTLLLSIVVFVFHIIRSKNQKRD